jgi:hypothetical protein
MLSYHWISNNYVNTKPKTFWKSVNSVKTYAHFSSEISVKFEDTINDDIALNAKENNGTKIALFC